MDTFNNKIRVCPVESAGQLDTRLRRLVQNPSKILKPYIHSNMTVLDMGCGPGFFTLEIARMLEGKGKVIAADIQKGMLDIIRKKSAGTPFESTIELHLLNNGISTISAQVDFILAFYVIHEIPQKEKVIRELKSVIKPGGLLFISEPMFHVTGKEFKNMLNIVESSGFKVIERPSLALSRTIVARG